MNADTHSAARPELETLPADAFVLAGSGPKTDSEYLGPGRVVRVEPRNLVVQLEEDAEREVSVELALSFPYRPVTGDRLLVVGHEGQPHYAIGILSGSAPAELSFQGDVSLQAVNGKLSLHGDAVEIDAPRVTLRAKTLQTFAGTLTETADSAYRWVKGLLTVRAGESFRVVTGEDRSQAAEVTILSKTTVKVDGDNVQLGH